MSFDQQLRSLLERSEKAAVEFESEASKVLALEDAAARLRQLRLELFDRLAPTLGYTSSQPPLSVSHVIDAFTAENAPWHN